MKRNMKANEGMRDTPRKECELEQSCEVQEIASFSRFLLQQFEARRGKKERCELYGETKGDSKLPVLIHFMQL